MKNKLINFYNLLNNLRKLTSESIIVYQMGKVGSSSIESFLTKKNIHVLHTHKISNTDVFFIHPEIKSKLKFFRVKVMYIFVEWIVRRKKCKIITIVRDPIDRALSQMFHHLDFLIYLHTAKDSRKEEGPNTLFKDIFTHDINYKYADEWMRLEFNNTMGIDYLDYQFDKDLGYGYIETDKKQALILRFENLPDLTDIIAEFVGVDDFNLERVNRGSHKWYGDLYKNFKSTLKIDNKIFAEIYKTDYFNHFYHKDILGEKRNKWVNMSD
jgi:hypothetical protein